MRNSRHAAAPLHPPPPHRSEPREEPRSLAPPLRRPWALTRDSGPARLCPGPGQVTLSASFQLVESGTEGSPARNSRHLVTNPLKRRGRGCFAPHPQPGRQAGGERRPCASAPSPNPGPGARVTPAGFTASSSVRSPLVGASHPSSSAPAHLPKGSLPENPGRRCWGVGVGRVRDHLKHQMHEQSDSERRTVGP